MTDFTKLVIVDKFNKRAYMELADYELFERKVRLADELAELVMGVFASRAVGTTAREYPSFDTLPSKTTWADIVSNAREIKAADIQE